MSRTEVIDENVMAGLIQSIGGDRDFLDELITTFFDDTPGLFSMMHTAIATGNHEEFRRAAHSLKSNSANFGAMSLYDLSQELEEMGRSRLLDEVAEHLAQAEAEYEQVRLALEAVRMQR
jgi:HPt (histidine-containing phosphotransfer) domain-containing protein